MGSNSSLEIVAVFIKTIYSLLFYYDNLGATYLSINPIIHSRTKRVDIDYHFVRDRIQAKTLQVSFLSSKDQLADIFIKPLSSSQFNTLRSSLTIEPYNSAITVWLTGAY